MAQEEILQNLEGGKFVAKAQMQKKVEIGNVV